MVKEHLCNTPKSAAEIMSETGIKSRRDLNKWIAEERKTTLILSDHHGGYYLADPNTPEGLAAVRKFESSMRSMAISCFASSKLARSILKDFERSSGANE